jgi:calcineurin-like phosphoesterase family protein
MRELEEAVLKIQSGMSCFYAPDFYEYAHKGPKPLILDINKAEIPPHKRIFFISDLHLGHTNILKYEPRTRGVRFSSIEEHDQFILDSWNEEVQDDDLVVCLGDLSLTTSQKATQMISSLKGIIVLVLGNHDSLGSVSYYQRLVGPLVYKHPIIINDWICSHKPLPIRHLEGFKGNIHGHTHSHFFLGPYINVCVEHTDYKPKRLAQIPWLEE